MHNKTKQQAIRGNEITMTVAAKTSERTKELLSVGYSGVAIWPLRETDAGVDAPLT